MCGQRAFQGPNAWAEIEKRKRPDGYNFDGAFFFPSFLVFCVLAFTADCYWHMLRQLGGYLHPL